MGISILELVLQRLREENFIADAAYPGRKYPLITEPVAAVHIEKVDRSDLSVTVEVNIICPASMGGTQAELEALRATKVLHRAGAECVQQRCSYDGVAQIYVVPVLATFTGITTEESFTLGPGFSVYINDTLMPFAIAFQAEQERKHEAHFEIGETAPIGISQGNWIWTIKLEELIPGGNLEAVTASELFELEVKSDTVTETYYHCRWTNVRREFTREGLRRIRTGIAMLREENDE